MYLVRVYVLLEPAIVHDHIFLCLITVFFHCDTQCELNPRVPYTQFSIIIKKQKEVIRQLIERKQAEIRKVHSGLTCFSQGIPRIDIQDIPGISESEIV